MVLRTQPRLVPSANRTSGNWARIASAPTGRLLIDDTDEVTNSVATARRPFSSSTVRSATPAAWMSPVNVTTLAVPPWSTASRRRWRAAG